MTLFHIKILREINFSAFRTSNTTNLIISEDHNFDFHELVQVFRNRVMFQPEGVWSDKRCFKSNEIECRLVLFWIRH